MHSFDRRGKRLSWRILSYALKRMRTDPPLDHSETLETLRSRAGRTVTPDGIGGDDAKKIVRIIKDSKMKVQAAIQGDVVRVTGNKRDDLQAAIALLKKEVNDLPLTFGNFRD